MNPKLIFIVCFLFIFATACAPAAPNTAETQSAGAADAAESAQGSEDEHSDEHGHEDDSERRELGAHEHGVAELLIAFSGSDVAIDLRTPSYNVLGFEYEPASDEEKALFDESVAALEAGELLQFSSDAGCTVVSANVQTAFEEAHSDEHNDEEGDHDDEGDHDEKGDEHGEDGHEDHGDESVHSEIDVSYNLECAQPENIVVLDATNLFAQFPNFEDIDVQWVSDTQASAAELTPDNPVVELQ